MSAPHHAPATAAETTKAIAARHGNRADALLEILHDLQHDIGFVPEDALPVLANAVNLSRAEVHGVVTFYHEFRREPAGQHVVKVCQAESCQAMGSRALAAAIRSSLKIDFGQTTADGAITLESVYCLGNCALSPAILVDGRMVGRVDASTFDKIAAELRT
jgi:formate dehydrogenase subunit gamma